MNDSEHKNDGIVSEGSVEKIARNLQVVLPKTNEPLGIKVIALFMLVGGLSLMGSTFTDIFGLQASFSEYFLRLITGLIAISIAYGLIMKMRWTIYAYAILLIIAILVNPIFSLVLGGILIYLITQKKFLYKGAVDAHFESIYEEHNKRKKEALENKK